jgi:hypothetical protein
VTRQPLNVTFLKLFAPQMSHFVTFSGRPWAFGREAGRAGAFPLTRLAGTSNPPLSLFLTHWPGTVSAVRPPPPTPGQSPNACALAGGSISIDLSEKKHYDKPARFGASVL